MDPIRTETKPFAQNMLATLLVVGAFLSSAPIPMALAENGCSVFQRLSPEPLTDALGRLPTGIQDLLFPASLYDKHADGYTAVSVSDPEIEDSKKRIVTVYSTGQKFGSRLVMAGGDLFVEGVYRNLYYQEEGNASAKTEFPWIEVVGIGKSRKFIYHPTGAAERLLEKVEQIYGSRPTLFRGLGVDRMQELLELKQTIMESNEKARAMAANISRKATNGAFTTPDKSVASGYADHGESPKQTMAKSSVSIESLKPLVALGELYVGVEYEFFEISFMGPNAFLSYAEHVGDARGEILARQPSPTEPVEGRVDPTWGGHGTKVDSPD